MARIFITGSTDGLGRATAQQLLGDGHQVIVHARSVDRLGAVKELLDRGAVGVVGDLSDMEQTRDVGKQVNRIGHVDAVIHNAGVLGGRHIFQVNVVAPYLLTALIDKPERLLYLSSGMHRGGRATVSTKVSYSDSKLYVTALATAVARFPRRAVPERPPGPPRAHHRRAPYLRAQPTQQSL